MSQKNKKKKLLFTAVNLEIGGIETALINLLNNINYDKYDVDVILEEKKGTLLSKVNENASVKELKVSTNKNPIIRKLINLSRKIIFAIFNYHKHDFSCCYATYSFSCNVITKLASTNNSIYVHSNYKDLYKRKQEFMKFFNDRKVEDYRKIIFVSNESASYFKEVYPSLSNKVDVINNFIDPKEIIELSNEKIKVKKPTDKKLFVFVGRLEDSAKKVSRAINLIKEIKNTSLWIIGDGPDRKMYEELVKNKNLEDKVTFFGKQKNPYPYMKQADYIILTSDYEGFPVTYLEAIALNKQLITTIDVSDESINVGKDFAYIISKDEKTMAKQVKEILSKKNKINQKVNIDNIQNERMKKLEEIFEEVI